MPSPSPLLQLPTELIQHILNHLDFPSLENFRHTSHTCMGIPIATTVNRAEGEYALALLTKEQKDAAKRYELWRTKVDPHWRLRPDQPPQAATYTTNNIHVNELTRAERLHCFTCYSFLDREQFTPSQRKGRRSYGHADAVRRFCIQCGFREKKWSPATLFKHGLLPCGVCRKIGVTDKEAKAHDMCRACFVEHMKESGAERGKSEPQVRDASPEAAESATRNITIEESLHGLDLSSEANVAVDQRKYPSEMSRDKQMRDYRPGSDSGLPVTIENGTSKRSQRCTRCWMIDHTFSPAEASDQSGQRLCGSCWLIWAHCPESKAERVNEHTSSPTVR
jgi:F-box domain